MFHAHFLLLYASLYIFSGDRKITLQNSGEELMLKTSCIFHSPISGSLNQISSLSFLNLKCGGWAPLSCKSKSKPSKDHFPQAMPTYPDIIYFVRYEAGKDMTP